MKKLIVLLVCLNSIFFANSQTTAGIFQIQAASCTNQEIYLANWGSSNYDSFSWSFSTPPVFVWGSVITDDFIMIVFPSGGTISITLTVSNSVTGQTDTDVYTFTINQGPNASFTTSGTICSGSPINFNNTSVVGSTPITSIFWNFGDQTFDDVNYSPAHTYENFGTFQASLYLVDAAGCESFNFGNVSIPDLSTTFTPTITAGCPCNEITYSASGTATSYEWDFGDGTTSTANSGTHTFTSPDSYMISVKGITATGCSYKKYEPLQVCPNDTLYTSKSNNNWQFHQQQGITFNSGSPVATNGQTINGSSYGGSSAISHPTTGALLFYTTGTKVWTASHTLMPNGSGLIGYDGTAQSSLIVPMPGNSNRYYIFHLNGHFGTPPYSMYYSVVDMTLNGGLGDVVVGQKNIQLLGGDPSLWNGRSILTGVVKKNADCNSEAEYWVVTSPEPGKLSSYLVSQSGIAAPIVTNISSAGTYGCASFSKSGGFFARADMATEGITLFNFDKQLGLFSNAKQIKVDPGSGFGYGSCFSPNERELYVTNGIGGSSLSPKLAQIHTTSPYLASNFNVLHNGGNFMQTIWMGNDNKMYIQRGGSNRLAVLNTPNNTGVGAGFVLKGVTKLNGSFGNGLQNIVPLNIRKKLHTTPSFSFTPDAGNCLLINFTNSTVLPNYVDPCSFLHNNDTVNFAWNFGDGNTSTQSGNVSHTYALSGNYTVQLIVNRPLMCTSDTIVQNVNVCVTPLSIELVDFQVSKDEVNDNVNIEWSTNSETSNDYFKLFKSTNASNWTELKKISGAGTTSNLNSYFELDKTPETGINYYKLEQTDFNGVTRLIGIRSIDISRTSYSVYPNPAENKIEISSTNDKNELIIYEIINGMGQQIIELESTESKVVFDISNIEKGVYYIKIKREKSIEIVQFLKI